MKADNLEGTETIVGGENLKNKLLLSLEKDNYKNNRKWL